MDVSDAHDNAAEWITNRQDIMIYVNNSIRKLSAIWLHSDPGTHRWHMVRLHSRVYTERALFMCTRYFFTNELMDFFFIYFLFTSVA